MAMWDSAVIRHFRFPHRNRILGRETTEEEQTFLHIPEYRSYCIVIVQNTGHTVVIVQNTGHTVVIVQNTGHTVVIVQNTGHTV